ncbi:MAG: hypothetical protein Q8937_20545 [Bacteroidota bacterium]|nr:hypothetical protein [Bacteroidota bacterium]MDP4260628.1 hypothetical protein [Bacteroidota bacterium]
MDNGKALVDPGFIEELEMLATLNRPCEIIFRSGNDARTVIRDRIAAVDAREGREWLVTGSGLVIGLAKLVEVDGKRPLDRC